MVIKVSIEAGALDELPMLRIAIRVLRARQPKAAWLDAN
jgi:hypothetical protein